jgi:hypothetical protein
MESALICPISALGTNFNSRKIKYIGQVEILAFLELEQISADFENCRFSNVLVGR